MNSNLPCRTLTAQPTYTPLPYDSQYSSGSPAVATLSVSQPVETGTSPPANDFAFDPLSGGIGQSSTDMIAAYALATRAVYDVVYVNGTSATESYHETGIATSSGTNAPSITTSGLLNGFGTSGGHISTPTLNLPIGRPFTIALDMLVQTRAVEQASSGSTDANVVAHGVTDFGNTFGFDTLGPVFSFPLPATRRARWTGAS